MRVLVVAHGHPENFPGGGEIAAYQLFQGLKQRGVEALFLAAAPAGFVAQRERLAYFGGRADEVVLRTEMSDFFTFTPKTQEQMEALALVVRAFKPDVVHLHHYVQLGIDALRTCQLAAPAAVTGITLHEFFALCNHNGQMVTTRELRLCHAAEPEACTRCFPQRSASHFVQRRNRIQSALLMADFFIAPSRFLATRYRDWGLPEDRFAVVENVAASGEMRLPPRLLAPGEGRRRFGFFGQVTPYKGLVPLLQAFADLAESDSGTARTLPAELHVHAANLHLNTSELQRTVSDLMVRAGDRVRMHGSYTRSELPGLMGGMDWIVIPSIWWENAPLVIEEALALGRPVICGGIGGMAEKVRDGVDGLHVPPGDSWALANLVQHLSCETKTWDRLRNSMRRPTPAGQALDAHLAIYRRALARTGMTS